MSKKQLETFQRIKVDKKIVIRNLQDLNNFLQRDILLSVKQIM